MSLKLRRNSYETNQYLEDIFSLFADLTAEEKELIKRNCKFISYKKGETLYKEGETPTALLCLVKGKVKVIKEGMGRDWISRLGKPIDMVGYRALFAEENYNALAQAIEPSIICSIEKQALFSVLSSNSKTAFVFMKKLAQELGFVNARTITLTQKHIRGRLAETLLLLATNYGFEEDNKTLKVYLSREDLANLSNMTASNAIRTLSTFKAEGLLSLDGRKILLNELELIEKISRLG